MLETELFALLEETADAAYTVTALGEVCSWNRAAEALFGYAKGEVFGRHIEEVLDAYDSLGTEPLVGGAQSAVRDPIAHRVPPFDLDVRTRSGERLWVNISTIVFDNRRTGRRLLVRLARDITHRRQNALLLSRMLGIAREVVALPENLLAQKPAETLTKHERKILQLLAEGNSSEAVIRKLKISAQTMRNHLHHINRKLRTNSRLEAVTQAQRRGLLK